MLRTWRTELPVLPDGSGKQAYNVISDVLLSEITTGRFKPGMALPGSRELAHRLNKSRRAVMQALEILIAKGWLYTVAKKGTFVSPQQQWPVAAAPQAKLTTDRPPVFLYNQFATDLALLTADTKPGAINFDDGFADLKLSPVKELMTAYRSLYEQHLRIKKTESFFADGPRQLLGELNLMLRQHRGLNIDQSRCAFIRGNQLTFFLTAFTLLKKGDVVAVENPGNLFAWDIFRQVGAELLPIPVDEEGIDTEALSAACANRRIKAVYVTPQCQYPTTVILSPRRRQHLMEVAQQYGLAIIETDFEHEFWFDTGQPVLPLAADYPDKTIYIGSLSRMLNPLMRIGFVTAPDGFIRSLTALNASVDSCGDFVLEKTVATLMSQGIINRYIRKSAAIYKERREQMDRLLHTYLGNAVSYRPPAGGLAFWLQFNTGKPLADIVEKLHSQQVSIPPPRLYHFNSTRQEPAVRIGFGSVNDLDMERGILALRSAIE